MSFQSINEELKQAAKDIEVKTFELNNATTAYLESEAFYDKEFSMFFLETKLKNPEMTQSEIKANAVCLAYESKLAMIKAESSYRKLQNEIKMLRDKLDSFKEISYNLRREFSQG